MQDSLIKRIKEKKELSGVSSKVIETILQEYSKKYRLDLSNLSKKESKIIVKEIRSLLRNYTGRFYKDVKSSSNISLDYHISTAERKEFYPKLKEIISKLNPSSILDLACGLNPIALASKEITYHASDINEEHLEIIKKYFKKNKISGDVFFCDLRNLSFDLPKADLCLLFKVLDIIDDRKHKISENILRKIDSKTIIVSFATKKISGRKMRFPTRHWFEKMVSRLKFFQTKFSSKNEVFYILSREPITEHLLE